MQSMSGQQKNRMGKRTIVYGIAAILLFGVIFCTTFHDRTEGMELRQAEIVTFGDSVFGLVRDETATPARLKELLGLSVFNAALGSTCMARLDTGGKPGYTKDALSMAGLAKAIWAGDFGVQHTLRMRESNTEYFAGVLYDLERVDFSRVKIVLIQQGINDYHAGTPIENPEDIYDEYTFLGAIRTSVKALRKVNPSIRIVLVTPTYSWYNVTGLTCEEADYGGGVLEAYVEAELRVARELDIDVIDVYHDFYPHDSFGDWELYTSDGLHPNEAGREKLAGRIAEELRALCGEEW